MEIYVSNLDFNVSEEDLRSYFTLYGEVIVAKIITDKETGRSRGFGFIEMSDDTAANRAITDLNGAKVEGRAINVTKASSREDKGGSSSRGGHRSFGNSRW